jgi:uncharacterized membrane protein
MKLKLPNMPISLAEWKAKRKAIVNVNDQHQQSLSALEKIAVKITDKVGSMGFFLIIFVWTITWCGYNILATEVPTLHWPSFDPFPAFVAYLLISNVIQIWLMPLLMVGQNLQSRHSDFRAESDFDINIKAEKEVEAILAHLEHQNELLYALVQKVGLNVEEILATNPAPETKP